MNRDYPFAMIGKTFLAGFFALLAVAPAQAGQPEAREVARMNNCPPKKIEVYQNQLGADGTTVYQVTCNLPKTTDKDAAPMPGALLISCDHAMCEMMRPVAPEKK